MNELEEKYSACRYCKYWEYKWYGGGNCSKLNKITLAPDNCKNFELKE